MFPGIGGLVAAFFLAAALVVASAKVHGRQVRLRREAEGHMHVDFRRDNDPWVEAMWARDRRWFWLLFIVLAAASVAAGVYLFSAARHVYGAPPAALTLLFLAWSFAATFLVMGVWWAIDLARSTHTTSFGIWMESLGWLMLALALAAAQWILLAW